MRLKKIIPIVPVADVLKSVEFFESVLGFSATVKSENHALLKLDDVALHLQPAGENTGEIAFYIEVEGIDALYERMKPALDRLPKGRVRSPFNQEYGQREFHVTDLDSLLIFFGEPIT